MDQIPEGFEPYVDSCGDELWVDEDGDLQYVGPTGTRQQPEPGWRRIYAGPPLPKPKTLEDKMRDLAKQFERCALEDPGPTSTRGVWRKAADDLRGLLS